MTPFIKGSQNHRGLFRPVRPLAAIPPPLEDHGASVACPIDGGSGCCYEGIRSCPPEDICLRFNAFGIVGINWIASNRFLGGLNQIRKLIVNEVTSLGSQREVKNNQEKQCEGVR